MDNSLKIYKSDFCIGENFILQKMFIKKGKIYAPHWHNYFEFEIIVDGEGEHIYNNNKYKLRRGDAYLMSYYDFHGLSATTDITLLSLHFNENTIQKELVRILSFSINRFKCKFDERETQNIINIFNEIDSERKDRKPYFDIATNNLISSAVILLLRKTNNNIKQYTPDIIQNAVGYMHNNFRKDLSLADVARACNVSTNYMGAMILKWTGNSFSDYINSIRVKYACNALAVSEISIKEIAFASGYNSVEYFSYVFKKKIGMTPLTFRKMNSSY